MTPRTARVEKGHEFDFVPSIFIKASGIVRKMKIYKESKLDNGLSIITSEDQNAEVVTISVWVRAGSRYEKKDERGYAHILEHMLLKGTKKRPSIFDVNVIMDRAGAASNAATNVEMVHVYIQVAKERFVEMFEVLAEIINEPLLSEDVLENEKKVILQEYDRAYDNPASRLWIESSKRVFEGHPLSQHPLGTRDSIASATPRALRDYYEHLFVSERMAVVVTGGVDHDAIVLLSNKHFGVLRQSDNAVEEKPAPLFRKGYAFEQMPITQYQVNFNFLGPATTLQEASALDVLANFLGYKHTSLLYRKVRHEAGLAYSIGVFDMRYIDATLFHIQTASTKPEEIIPLIIDEVIHIERSLTPELFEEYKEQLINAFLRVLSNQYDEMVFLGNAWLQYGRLLSPMDRKMAIKNLTYSTMIDVKNRFLKKENLFVMTLGEKEFTPEL